MNSGEMHKKYFTEKDKQKLLNKLVSLQNSDGGFSIEKNEASTLKCSYYIFRSLLKLNKIDSINRQNTKNNIFINEN